MRESYAWRMPVNKNFEILKITLTFKIKNNIMAPYL